MMIKRIWKNTIAALTMALLLLIVFSVFTRNNMFSMRAQASPVEYTVSVSSGYLTLRSTGSYGTPTELGRLYNGELFVVIDVTDPNYWYGMAPTLGNLEGYVDKNYLTYGYTSQNATSGSSSSGNSSTQAISVPAYTVSVSSGYLALRSSDTSSYTEIAQLYNGEKVLVTDNTRSGDYWFVFSVSQSRLGYVNKNYLVGGTTMTVSATSYTAKVSEGYLALRTAKAYEYSNEIGKLYTGTTVQVLDSSGSQYWFVYAPSLSKFGYVNKDYLTNGSSAAVYSTKTVKVASGYLALRTAKAYDYRNEIGKLYTGDTVQVTDTSDSQYWYVYAPSLNMYGYVNKDYLY